MFVVIDCRTGAVVARCKTITGARRSADRRDMEYGAYRYSARAAMPNETAGFKKVVDTRYCT
jgi:hypothetical protein